MNLSNGIIYLISKLNSLATHYCMYSFVEILRKQKNKKPEIQINLE